MKKLKTIIIVFLAIVFFSILFSPRKICSDNGNVRIDRIVYNKQFGSGESNYDRIEIENYDPDEIIKCISKYKSYFTLSRSSGYSLEKSEIEVFFVSNRKSKQIVLGTINCENHSGGLRRNIINADELKKELELLLELPKLKGEEHDEENY